MEGTRYDHVPDIDDAIYLYNGVPTVENEYKIVCFTCPGQHWLDSMWKNSSHIALYIPMWSLDEIKYANTLLNLVDKTIEARYFTHGGTARWCLETDPSRAEELIERILGHARCCQSMSEIEDYLISETIGKYSQPVFFMNPVISHAYPSSFEYVFCSKRVLQEILTQIWLLH